MTSPREAINAFQNMPASEKIQTALTVTLLTWKKILDMYDRDAPAATAYKQASEMVRKVLRNPDLDLRQNAVKIDKSAAVLFAMLDGVCLSMLAADPKLTETDFVDALEALEKDFDRFVTARREETTKNVDRKAN